MKKINPANLRNLEAQARAIGKTVDSAINPPDPATGRKRRRNGFALLLFSFEGPELTWISNGEKDDMVKVLEEMLSRFKTGRMTDFPGGVDASN